MSIAPHGRRWRLMGTLAAALTMNAAAAQQAPGHQASPGFRWPETLADIQAADKLPSAPLEAFLDGLRPIGVPPLQMDAGICLAAAVGDSAMKRYFNVAVVCPSPQTGTFQMTVLQSYTSHFLGAEIMDLDGDGTFEIVTRELAGGYRGTRTLPMYWYSVYRVKGSVPRDVSASYKRFYDECLLPWLDFFSRLLGPTDSAPSAVATEVRAEAQFLRARYERRIMGKPKAGFEDAVRWSNSDNAQLQLLAVWTFGDIATPEAVAELRKLEKATDYAVSQDASYILNKTEPRR